jgi:hypothetical protein
MDFIVKALCMNVAQSQTLQKPVSAVPCEDGRRLVPVIGKAW